MALAILAIAVGARALYAGEAQLTRLDDFERRSGVDIGPETPWFASGIGGDADIYAIIAVDPWGEEAGRRIFDPSYRYSRAGYSWGAALVTLGDPDLALLGLSVVGALSVVTTAVVALRLTDTLGNRALLILANPALYIGFLYDTAEPLAIALLTVALSGGSIFALLALSVVRPSYLVGAAPLGRRFVLALAAAVVFRLYWAAHFGDPVMGGVSNLALPFLGVWSTPSVTGVLVVAAGAFTVVVGLARRDLGWILAGLMVCSLSEVVYDTPVNAVRAAGLLPVLWAYGPGHARRLRLARRGAAAVEAPA